MIKKKNIALYIILGIITLGISNIFFWYRWTEDLNKLCDGDDKDSANYILVLILDFLTCGLYALIWNYQMAERIYKKAPEYGAKVGLGGTAVMLFRFIPFVSSIIKLININKLINGYNAANAQAEAVVMG